MVYKEIALTFDNPSEEYREVKFDSSENLKISCVEDGHVFHWFSRDPVPDYCLCGRVKNVLSDDRILHERNLRVVHGDFSKVP